MKRWPYPRLFAHRGGGRHAPENTLAAIRLGQELGYAAHEIDVKLTRDGVLVLMHDATLERTTSGQGRAADLTAEELVRLDAGGWHSEAFRGEPVPTFEAVARALRERGTLINVEIKPTPGFDSTTGRAVARACRTLWPPQETPPLLSSFSFEALLAAREEAPELPRAWLIDAFTDADWDRLAALDAVAVHTNHRKFDLALLDRLHAAGYRVNLYTVNDAHAAQRFLDAGVDGLFTDELELFAQRFGALREAPRG